MGKDTVLTIHKKRNASPFKKNNAMNSISKQIKSETFRFFKQHTKEQKMSEVKDNKHSGISEFEALRAAWFLLVEELTEQNLIDRGKLSEKFEDILWMEESADGRNGNLAFYQHQLTKRRGDTL